MTMNRVQFQPDLSMTEFMQRYGSDAQCEAALVALRWPDFGPLRGSLRDRPGGPGCGRAGNGAATLE
jgi:hypothetical protein